MKDVNQRTHTDLSSGVQDEIAISFEANAVAFYAQISGLAKDKIGYPIRELSTNAWDASRGRFEVHLPTQLDPTFKVRDKGPGMSHDQMVNVYARLYASTKRATDQEVGGWGLGSKSPFAYLIGDNGTGSYTVTSYHGGMARTYVLSLGASGAPVMRLLMEIESTEESGLEVSFPVQRHDINRFRDRAREILWSFEPRPTLKPDLEWDEPVVLASGEGWKFYNKNSVPFYGPQVRMGPVMYPFDLDQIKMGNFLSQHDHVVFDAKIGTISVTLSREAVAYDDRTKATLKALVEKYEAAYIGNVQTKVNEADSWLDACHAFSEATESLDQTRRTYVQGKVTWQPEGDAAPLKLNRYVSSDDEFKFMHLRKNWSVGTYDKFERGSINTFAKYDVVAVEHNPHRSLERLTEMNLIGKSVLWVRARRDDVALAMQRIGNPEYVVLDDAKLEKRLSGTSQRPKTLRKRRTFTVGSYGWNAETQDVDMAEGGFFVEAESLRSSWSMVQFAPTKRTQQSTLSNAIRVAVQLELIPIGTVILRRTPNEELNENWKWLGDHLAPLLNSKIDFSQFTGLNNRSVYHMGNGLQTLAYSWNSSAWPADLRQLHEDAKLLRARLQAGERNVSHTDKAFTTLSELGYPVTVPDVADPIELLKARYTALGQKYQLLQMIIDRHDNRHTASTRGQRDLDYYFNLLRSAGQLVEDQEATNDNGEDPLVIFEEAA